MKNIINDLAREFMGKSKYGPIKIVNTKSLTKVMHFELTDHA